jgi:hypothetical protein
MIQSMLVQTVRGCRLSPPAMGTSGAAKKPPWERPSTRGSSPTASEDKMGKKIREQAYEGGSDDEERPEDKVDLSVAPAILDPRMHR